jgi:hypothetical protein
MKSAATAIVAGLVGISSLVLSPIPVLRWYFFDDVSHVTAGELRTATEGLWVFESGDRFAVVTMRQAGTTVGAPPPSLVGTAGACDDQTFVRSAQACVPMSSMPLELRVIGGNLPVASHATFTAEGNHFHIGILELADYPYRFHVFEEGRVNKVDADSMRIRRIAFY